MPLKIEGWLRERGEEIHSRVVHVMEDRTAQSEVAGE
jgi:hypothetical protein